MTAVFAVHLWKAVRRGDVVCKFKGAAMGRKTESHESVKSELRSHFQILQEIRGYIRKSLWILGVPTYILL